MEIARKISIGAINGVRKGFKNIEKETFVARLIGIARGAVMEEGTNGAYWKFTGEFRAVNMDGEEFAAPVAFMPAPADQMLADIVNQKGEDGKPVHAGGVQFGFDFSVIPREDVAIGYSYKVKPLLESKPSDPLAELMGAVAPLQIAPKAQTALPLADATATEQAPAAEAKPAAKAKK